MAQVHWVLTQTTHVGRHKFNKRGKDRTKNLEAEVITVAGQRMIDQQTLYAVQAVLHARNPKTRTCLPAC